MSSQIAELERQYEAVAAEAGALVEGLSGEAFVRRPAPNRWSPAENLVHLRLSAEMWLPGIRYAVNDLRARGPKAGEALRLNLMGRFLKWIVEPPARMRVATRGGFLPGPVERAEEVLPAFLERQRELIGLLRQADGWALDRVKVVSPFDERVSLNLYATFHIIVAHERRHLWQARQAATGS
jgi:hypothetical protein